MENNARFKLENGRIVRVNERPKVCFLTVMCEAGKYPARFDVTVFEPPTFPLEEGQAVTVSGELSMRKPKEEGGRWELQLIARRIDKGDDAKAPGPRRSEDRPQGTARPQTPVSDEPGAPDDDLLF